ncbi:tetratricopeptide repeat protein [Thalassotalea nanhaiensis]|uniref:Ancillary SecYEG translocon subunit n=1 Tax=Thalassotalea nanhaiensis TaxID=3065648 RepID=A0ABY9TKJ9_9GAMM|nr:tetratricopeptide repeat protein [Colwelliaceae bacterium SQ345]
METYQTEEQQVEAIKGYWKENGNSLIAGLVIGLGGFIGWNYYQDSVVEAQQVASYQYQQTMQAFESEEADFRANTQAFIDANSTTAYSAFAAFALAKDAVEHEDFAGAETQLKKAVELAANENIKAIAYLRLARVQIQLEAFDNALATLAQTMPETFKASIEETKGDTYLKQGNTELARTAYQAAADAGGLQANPTLQIKLDDLAVNVAG